MVGRANGRTRRVAHLSHFPEAKKFPEFLLLPPLASHDSVRVFFCQSDGSFRSFLRLSWDDEPHYKLLPRSIWSLILSTENELFGKCFFLVARISLFVLYFTTPFEASKKGDARRPPQNNTATACRNLPSRPRRSVGQLGTCGLWIVEEELTTAAIAINHDTTGTANDLSSIQIQVH